MQGWDMKIRRNLSSNDEHVSQLTKTCLVVLAVEGLITSLKPCHRGSTAQDSVLSTHIGRFKWRKESIPGTWVSEKAKSSFQDKRA